MLTSLNKQANYFRKVFMKLHFIVFYDFQTFYSFLFICHLLFSISSKTHRTLKVSITLKNPPSQNTTKDS